MHAYFAIIRDAFREAFSSQVLWLMLLLITLALVAIFPIGLREKVAVGVHERDVESWPSLGVALIRASSDQDTPAKKLWSLLSEESQKAATGLADATKSQPKQGDVAAFIQVNVNRDILHRGINEALSGRNWYDSKLFRGMKLRDEAQELLKKYDSLDERSIKRVNRLLFEGTFPSLVRASGAKSLHAHYWPFESDFELRGSPEEIREEIPKQVTFVFDYSAGIAVVFIGFLITAPILPQMFETGSLHLLLSKPLSRSLLLLSKFSGGCLFVAICSGYAMLGLWAYFGVRHGIWIPHFLVAIPIYTFMFAVYYSVSAFAGIYSRSTIVAVIVGILFWVACFSLDSTKGAMDSLVAQPNHQRNLIVAKNKFVAVRRIPLIVNRDVVQFDDGRKEWESIYSAPTEGLSMSERVTPLLGPFYDPTSGRLYSVQGGPFGPQSILSFAEPTTNWSRQNGIDIPAGPLAIRMTSEGKLLCVTRAGIYVSNQDPWKEQEKVLGIQIPFFSSEPFDSIGPENWQLSNEARFAWRSKDSALAVITRESVAIYVPNSNGKYVLAGSKTFSSELESEPAVAIEGNLVIVADGTGVVTAYTAPSLEEVFRGRPLVDQFVRFIGVSPTGKSGIVGFENGAAWTFDAETKSLTPLPSSVQGEVWSATYNPDGELFLSTHFGRIQRLNEKSREITLESSLEPTLVERVYRYGVLPLHAIAPKPRELTSTVESLLPTRTKVNSGRRLGGEDSVGTERKSPFRPILSSAAFTIVVLLIACVWFERSEF